MSKQFIGAIILVLLILGGVAVANKHDTVATSGPAKPTSHITGAGSKKVTLVAYEDFQCPFCGQYYPTIRQVTETYKNDITFQFHHFPLTNLHQNAFAASRAAEAAGLQDKPGDSTKFYAMYDILYQRQSQWSTSNAPQSTFEQYAALLKLDAAKFKLDYASGQVNDAINADMAEGNRLGITGTPTFYLDGKQVQLANSVAAFSKAIDIEISKKNPSGISSPTPTSSTDTTAAPANQ